MAQVAILQAVEADTGKVRHTMEVTEARASEAVKWAKKFKYDVVDFYVTFFEPDTHTITVYIRPMKQ